MRLKKYLLSLFILGLGLLNFSNGFILYKGETYNSDYTKRYDVVFGDYLNFTTEGNSSYKVMPIQNGNRTRSVFWNNGKLYALYTFNGDVIDWNSIQGYFTVMCKMSGLSGYGCGPSNRPGTRVDYSVFDRDEYKHADFVDFRDTSNAELGFCFGYNDLDERICFFTWKGYSQYALEGDIGLTSNSIDGNPQFSTLAENSPFTVISSGGGGGERFPTNRHPIGTVGNSTYTEITVGDMLGWYQQHGYSDYMCYGGTTLGNDYGIPTPGEGAYITNIYNYSVEGVTGTVLPAKAWWKTYANLYNIRLSQGVPDALVVYNSDSPFTGLDKNVWNLLYFIREFSVPVFDNGGEITIDRVVDFCDISLQAPNLPYTGDFPGLSPIEIIDIQLGNYSDILVTSGGQVIGILDGLVPGSGKIFDQMYLNDSGEYVSDNVLSSWSDLYGNLINAISEHSNDYSDTQPVVPYYIIVTLILIILFRLLRN